MRKRVFDSHDLTASTKLSVYKQCLMPLLMYGSETWTLHQHEVGQLRTIQRRHLRLILKIKWDHFISNEELLKRAGTEDIEVMLVRSRLRWLGHVCRMDDNRPQKQLLYGELASGSLWEDQSYASRIAARVYSNQASPWIHGKPLSNIAQNGTNR